MLNKSEPCHQLLCRLQAKAEIKLLTAVIISPQLKIFERRANGDIDIIAFLSAHGLSQRTLRRVLQGHGFSVAYRLLRFRVRRTLTAGSSARDPAETGNKIKTHRSAPLPASG